MIPVDSHKADVAIMTNASFNHHVAGQLGSYFGEGILPRFSYGEHAGNVFQDHHIALCQKFA